MRGIEIRDGDFVIGFDGGPATIMGQNKARQTARRLISTGTEIGGAGISELVGRSADTFGGAVEILERVEQALTIQQNLERRYYPLARDPEESLAYIDDAYAVPTSANEWDIYTAFKTQAYQDIVVEGSL